jgi:hypothetical protein
MVRLFVLLAFLTLSACAASPGDTAQRIGRKFVGNKIDAVVTAFGPPASSFKMATGESVYQWQLASAMNVNSYSANSVACKLNVTASADGTVTRVTTQDVSNGFGESLCAVTLGIAR